MAFSATIVADVKRFDQINTDEVFDTHMDERRYLVKGACRHHINFNEGAPHRQMPLKSPSSRLRYRHSRSPWSEKT